MSVEKRFWSKVAAVGNEHPAAPTPGSTTGGDDLNSDEWWLRKTREQLAQARTDLAEALDYGLRAAAMAQQARADLAAALKREAELQEMYDCNNKQRGELVDELCLAEIARDQALKREGEARMESFALRRQLGAAEATFDRAKEMAADIAAREARERATRLEQALEEIRTSGSCSCGPVSSDGDVIGEHASCYIGIADRRSSPRTHGGSRAEVWDVRGHATGPNRTSSEGLPRLSRHTYREYNGGCGENSEGSGACI